MIRLIELRDGAAQRLLPADRDAVSWHAALTQEIAAHLSPAHAALLARPERTPAGLDWHTEGQSRIRYADLPSAGRMALDRALGAILSDIRRLAESGVALAVTAAWPALREIPDQGFVFAVDGRPVLAGWGHASTGVAGRLARLDDGIAWRAQPRPRWGLYGGLLGGLAALALASGLLLPMAYRWLVPAPTACAIVPGQLEALGAQLREEERGAGLRTLLATLTEEIGRKQLQCPLPAAPPVVPPRASPAPPPAPPPPRAALPQGRWDRSELAMLEGCWHLETELFIDNGTHTPDTKIAEWKLCFGQDGGGNHTARLVNGRQCSGPLAASFDAPALMVTMPGPCTGTLQVNRSELRCTRSSDTEAACVGRNLGGPSDGSSFRGRFRR